MESDFGRRSGKRPYLHYSDRQKAPVLETDQIFEENSFWQLLVDLILQKLGAILNIAILPIILMHHDGQSALLSPAIKC